MAIASVFVLRLSSSFLLPLQEALQDQQVLLISSLQSLLLPWDPEQVKFCVWLLRVKFSFSTVPWLSPQMSPICFQCQTVWGLILLVQETPRLGSLMWGSDHSHLRENLCSCDHPAACGLPTQAWKVWTGPDLHPSYTSTVTGRNTPSKAQEWALV